MILNLEFAVIVPLHC